MYNERNVLSQNKVKEYFTYDGHNLIWKISLSNRIKIGDVAGTKCDKYYRVRINKIRYMIHCLIWIYNYGDIPEYHVVDHKDGNTFNYSLENLQLLNEHNNTIKQKIRKSNTSGYKGVYYRKDINKWCATITYKRKKYPLGNFENKEIAALEYNKAAISFYGEHAVLNAIKTTA